MTYYEQCKRNFIEEYKAKHDKMVKCLSEQVDKLLVEQKKNIEELENILTSNGYNIIGLGVNQCGADLTVLEPKCYYKVQKTGCSFVINLVCAFTNKGGQCRPYFYAMSTIDRAYNKGLSRAVINKFNEYCIATPIRELWLTNNDFSGTNELFFEHLNSLSNITDIDSVNRYNFVRKTIAENKKVLKALNKL